MLTYFYLRDFGPCHFCICEKTELTTRWFYAWMRVSYEDCLMFRWRVTVDLYDIQFSIWRVLMQRQQTFPTLKSV